MTTTNMASLPPRTFADQNMKVTYLAVPPTKGLQGITVAELEAGLDASCRLAKDGTRFAPTDSETVDDAAICQPAGAQVPGRSNYEASANIFRFFDPKAAGKADAEGDKLFSALRVKGSPGVFVIRLVNKKWSDVWTAGDEYTAYSVTSDNWRPMDDTTSGYIKATVPLLVQDAEINGVVAAAT